MRALRRGVVVVIAVSLPVITTARLHVWGNGERGIWTEAVQHSPEKPRPRINLGRWYVLAGAEELGVAQFQTARDLARSRVRLEGPMRAGDLATLNIALVRAGQRRYGEALALTSTIQPRSDRHSLVNVLEAQWRREKV